MAIRRAVERDELIARLTREGHKTRDIAHRLGITERTVSRSRIRSGCAKPAQIPMSEDEISRAKQMLDDGASYAEVARTLGRYVTTFYKKFPGQGWSLEDTAAYNALRQREMKLGMRERNVA